MKRINITLVSLFLVLFLYLPFTSATQKEVGRDGVYVAYANGIVLDKRTGLEWLAGPDEDTTWDAADTWVENVKNGSTGPGGKGWRMPTVNELQSLYKKGIGTRNMTPLLKTTGWYVWSGETQGSSDAMNFIFGYGYGGWYYTSGSAKFRAFAVRSRSDG